MNENVETVEVIEVDGITNAGKQQLIESCTSELFNNLATDEKDDAEKMLATIRTTMKTDGPKPVVRSRLYEGMEFQVTGITVTDFTPTASATNPNPSTIYTVFVTTSTGARVKAEYFGSVDSEIGIGVNDDEVCRFVAYHKKRKTNFKLSEYEPRKGTYGVNEGENKYRAEYGKVIIKK